MGLMRVWLLVLLAACWRGGEITMVGQEPRSFVARVHGLVELQRATEAVHGELATALHRILRLATEDERTAIRDELRVLAQETAQLAARARAARASGDDPVVLERVERSLAQAAVMLAQLHDGLLYARTLAELEELERVTAVHTVPLAYSDADAGRFAPATLRWHPRTLLHGP